MSDQVEGPPPTQLTPELQRFLHDLSPHLWTSFPAPVAAAAKRRRSGPLCQMITRFGDQ
jgi:hypothetical protein